MKRIVVKGMIYEVPNFIESLQILCVIGVAFAIPFGFVHLLVTLVNKLTG